MSVSDFPFPRESAPSDSVHDAASAASSVSSENWPCLDRRSQLVGSFLRNDRSQFNNCSRPRRLVALPWQSILHKLTGSAAGIRKTLAYKVIDFREAIRLEQLSGEAQRASGHQASSFSSL